MTNPLTLILDLCAGPGGWSQALRALGLSDVGIELDPSACATRAATGHTTVRADIAFFPVHRLIRRLWGLIASPPCQGFSMAGLRAGWDDLDLIRRALADLAAGRDTRAELAARAADPRSLLMAEPLRYALAGRPEWVACEQVPGVLPLWRETARHLRAAGYSTWTGVLNAADYGVPQTRTRAILIASRIRQVHRPEPTHAKNPDAGVLFGPELRPWISMAQALGWSEPAIVNTRGQRRTPGGNEFCADRPAWTLTEKTRSWMLRAGTRTHSPVRGADQPSPTLVFGHALNDISWVRERPATTVGSTARIAKPGHRDRAHGERQFADSVRIEAWEAAVLQGFPPDYPWQGTKTKVFEQIGNAVPPPLARAVLAEATGLHSAVPLMAGS